MANFLYNGNMDITDVSINKNAIPIHEMSSGDMVSYFCVNPSGTFSCSFINEKELNEFINYLMSISGKKFKESETSLNNCTEVLKQKIEELQQRLQDTEAELEELYSLQRNNTIASLEP
jgi:flagellar capping protein FliD